MLAQLAAAGVTTGSGGDDDDDDEGDPVYLWPDCVDAWAHWQSLRTQWRTGMAGATGLDYAGVRAYLDEQCIEPGDERRELFDCIRAAEAASLEAWEERRAADERRREQQK